MKIVPRPGIKGLQRIYVIQVLQGLLVTLRHVARNLLHPGKLPVVFYPEERKHLPPAMRGRHRLMKREDGEARCTACMLCATACPAECIHILAAPVPDTEIEKYPAKFDIDMLRCVFCGFCVEACPLDAIRMDVPEIAIADYTRESLVYHKEFLMDHHNEEYAPGYNPPRPVKWTHGDHARP